MAKQTRRAQLQEAFKQVPGQQAAKDALLAAFDVLDAQEASGVPNSGVPTSGIRGDHPFIQGFKKQRELEALELDLRLKDARERHTEVFSRTTMEAHAPAIEAPSDATDVITPKDIRDAIDAAPNAPVRAIARALLAKHQGDPRTIGGIRSALNRAKRRGGSLSR